MSNGSWDSDLWHAETVKQYERLGFGRGYAMFGTPAARIVTAKLVIVGLNPGGQDGDLSWEWDGFAVADQRWGADDGYNTFQKQMLALLAGC